MNINLHANACTTPSVRAYIQSSPLKAPTLAKQLGISITTAIRWKKRTSTNDLSHRPHNLHATLNAEQEDIVIYIRRHFRLPLDDLLAVIHEFISPHLKRNALSRLLNRFGENRLPKPPKERPTYKPFKDYLPGYFHIDAKYLPKMPNENKARFLFVAIDRATRWVFIRLYDALNAENAKDFLQRLNKASPVRIHKLLTDNGKEFRAQFDDLCAMLGLEHRRTQPYHPQTNGMVERFNGRIANILQSKHFDSGQDLSDTLYQYAKLYNEHLPQRSIGHQPPWTAMCDYLKDNPTQFNQHCRLTLTNLSGYDKYAKQHGI